MGALIPLLLQLAPLAIEAAELAFAHKPKSGPEKMPAAIAIMQQLAEHMLNAKAPLADGSQVQPGTVDDKVIRGILESELARSKVEKPQVGLWFLQGTITPVNQPA